MATSGEKEIKNKWPVTEGLTARTTSQKGRVMNLIPTNSSKILQRNKKGL